MFSAPTFYFSLSVWLTSLWPTYLQSDHFCVHSSKPQCGHKVLADIATSLYLVILIPFYVLFWGTEMGENGGKSYLGNHVSFLGNHFSKFTVDDYILSHPWSPTVRFLLLISLRFGERETCGTALFIFRKMQVHGVRNQHSPSRVWAAEKRTGHQAVGSPPGSETLAPVSSTPHHRQSSVPHLESDFLLASSRTKETGTCFQLNWRLRKINPFISVRSLHPHSKLTSILTFDP